MLDPSSAALVEKHRKCDFQIYKLTLSFVWKNFQLLRTATISTNTTKKLKNKNNKTRNTIISVGYFQTTVIGIEKFQTEENNYRLRKMK